MRNNLTLTFSVSANRHIFEQALEEFKSRIADELTLIALIIPQEKTNVDIRFHFRKLLLTTDVEIQVLGQLFVQIFKG